LALAGTTASADCVVDSLCKPQKYENGQILQIPTNGIAVYSSTTITTHSNDPCAGLGGLESAFCYQRRAIDNFLGGQR
jgi:hypothetical protein